MTAKGRLYLPPLRPGGFNVHAVAGSPWSWATYYTDDGLDHIRRDIAQHGSVRGRKVA